MSGLEVPGLVIGAVSVAMAFKAAIDTTLFIESFFDDAREGCGYLALCYHIEKTRLQLWGELCRINDGSQSKESTLRDKPDYLKALIVRILGEIRKLNEEANGLIFKYNIDMATLPALDLDDNLGPNCALPVALSKKFSKPKSRIRWTIKGKAEFQEVVTKLRKLVSDLHELNVHSGDLQLPQRALPPQVLAPVTDSRLLQILSNPQNHVDRTLTASARAKSLYQRLDRGSAGSVTIITDKELEFRAGSSATGVLFHPSGQMLPVWVEWNLFDSGPGSSRYVALVKSLGYLLERVSQPELCLPPCYGVYDDLRYETEHGLKRLGFVFGLPQSGPSVQLQYEANLQLHPPTSLNTLIKEGKSAQIPLLGDRFRLAYRLVHAFSLFHAAGWLHKGIHSGNIIFLQPANSVGITVLQPFITGFQYSRPQDAVSLSRGPLEDSALDQYYHPDAHLGFSKRRDLYGLGVVLCEVGRWALVADTVPDRMRKKLISREAWREYMLNYVVKDLGWRMGKLYQEAVKTLLESSLPSDDAGDALFAQQFLERVIQPLSTCSA
ncbi:prion-inhibition and propagation-domain-containing protein [Aspergillus minisclerotigenes]|uniref:Prion-inhibition and propagation-domain-containing protein n=1 Tax=Aspergillus minisclerotigenes TaxID=656917 RepID=A0A5N6J1C4_9EURO|nr:prion-inhibition and propagation-domain-containing protein [Aspergillus minisclerotigenes]